MPGPQLAIAYDEMADESVNPQFRVGTGGLVGARVILFEKVFFEKVICVMGFPRCGRLDLLPGPHGWPWRRGAAAARLRRPSGKEHHRVENHYFVDGRPTWLDNTPLALKTGPVVFLSGGGCFFSNGQVGQPALIAVALACYECGPLYEVGEPVGPA